MLLRFVMLFRSEVDQREIIDRFRCAVPFQHHLLTRRAILSFIAAIASSPTICAQQPAPYFFGDRIMVDATVDDSQVRLVLDTGATFTALFQSTAKRLKLSDGPNRKLPVAGANLIIGRTPPVDFSIFGTTNRLELATVAAPEIAGIDGVLSWRDLRTNHLLIDGKERRVHTPPNIPGPSWQSWKLDRSSAQLFFWVTENGKEIGRVFVDTGAPCGLRVSSGQWNRWKDNHPDAVLSLDFSRDLTGQDRLSEVSWANEFRLGDLTLKNLDVGSIPTDEFETGTNDLGQTKDIDGRPYIAVLGVRGLACLRLMIARESELVLTQSVKLFPNHNKIGAAFLHHPKNSRLHCRVIAGSPAHQSGLRDDDILLSINEKKFDKDSSAAIANSYFAAQPGKKLKIKILRDSVVQEYSISLENLFP